VAWTAWRDMWTAEMALSAVEMATPWAVAVDRVSGLWERGDAIPGVADTLGTPVARYVEESARLGGEQTAEAIETWPETRVQTLAEALEKAVTDVLVRK
jgi:hypothetical protein